MRAQARSGGTASPRLQQADDAHEEGAGEWEYAVCLTKMDKGSAKAVRGTARAVSRAAEEIGCPEPVGIVATSSKSKAGRAAMWRLMRRLVLQEDTEHEEH